MSDQANSPRKASADLLVNQLRGLKLVCGIVAKATRAYKSANKQDSLTQTAVATAVGGGITQPQVSQFENGEYIPPNNAELNALLSECGFDLNSRGGAGYRNLLIFLRDSAPMIDALPAELPK